MNDTKSSTRWLGQVSPMVLALISPWLAVAAQAEEVSGYSSIPSVASAPSVSSYNTIPSVVDKAVPRKDNARSAVSKLAEPDSETDKRFLDVSINGQSKKLIGEFVVGPDGQLYVEPGELLAVGIQPVKQASQANGLINLPHLPNVTYQYDPEAQTINFVTQDMAALAPTEISLMPGRRMNARQRYEDMMRVDTDGPKPSSVVGGLINYTLYADSGDEKFSGLWDFQGVSGQFDARVFGPYGTLSSNQVVRFSSGAYDNSVRLDTSWSYWDDKRLVSYTFGDFVTRSLPWTRSVRMGGIQYQRNFSIRSDLVTMPLPSLSGSAAVPTTADIYINNAKRSTSNLPAGPYRITDFPVVTGANDARIVVRDALGRETVTEVPFYASIDMLQKGLTDFSIEAGFMRYYFGTESFEYGHDPAVSATIRHGLTDHLTLEGHVEGTSHYYGGGAGTVFNIGSLGAVSLSGSASSFKGETGQQASAGFEVERWGMRLNARTQRSFGNYNDLASATARSDDDHDYWDLNPDYTDPSYWDNYYSGSDKPPKSQDQISLGVPLKFDPTTLNLTFSRTEYYDTEPTKLLSFSASRSFNDKVFGYATAFKDLKESDNYGIFVGLSIRLGNDVQLSMASNTNHEGSYVQTELRKSETQEIGSTGWALRDVEGSQTSRYAYGSYRSRIARVSGSVEQTDEDYRMTGQVEGSVVFADKSLFAANQIDDSFAIVNAGAPNVPVMKNNLPYGKTGRNGKLIVPGLHSYQSTSLGIDAEKMPLDALVSTTRTKVMPAYRTGVVADFGVETAAKSSMIAVKTQNGEVADLGSIIRGDNNEQIAIIGYDGQTLLPLDGIKLPAQFIVELAKGGTCMLQVGRDVSMGVEGNITELQCTAIND